MPPYSRVVEGVGLREGLEQALELGRIDPDAGVRHLEAQDDLRTGALNLFHGDANLPRLGELDRIACEVEQDLAHPSLVAADERRQGRRRVGPELEPLPVRCGGEQVADVLGAALGRKGDFLELQAPRFDSREHVVDEREQRVGRGADGLGVVALGSLERGVEQQLGHADHAVHGRSDLVAHVREEGRLGA